MPDSTPVDSISEIFSEESNFMLTEFVLSFGWLAVAFAISTQVLITEFRRVDCIHLLFESTRAELEKRGEKEILAGKNTPSAGIPDFDFMNTTLYRETPETLEGYTHCANTSSFEKITLRKLPLQ